MPSPDQIKSQLANTLPAISAEDVSHFVDAATRPDNLMMPPEQLLNLLVSDQRIAHLLTEIARLIQSGGANLGTGNSIGQMGDVVGDDKVAGDVVEGDKIDLHFDGDFDPKLLIEIIRSAVPAPVPPPPAQPRDTTIDLYNQQFIVALRKLAAPKYNFPLTFRLISETGAAVESSTGIPIDQLIANVRATRLTLLRGAAGSGKSTAMQRTAKLIAQGNQGNIVPIYLQLRELKPATWENFSDVLDDDADPEQHIEPLLASSIVPLGIADLKRLGDRALSMEDGLIVVMADGLNEIYGDEAANSILKRLTTYVIDRGLSARALITDRITPRDSIQQWQLARIELLTPEVVLDQFKAKQIDAIYNQLTDNDRTLLQTPYFLVYALEHNTSRLSSATEAIAAFFKELDFSDAALDRMAKAAFDAYKKDHSSRFVVQPFEQAVEQATFRRLVDEGVVTRLSNEADPQAEEQAQFDHPLKHDYLAARYLSQYEDQWTPAALDVVSFESNSFDALSMTLELLPNEAQSDTFIERVHSWSWAAALVCISKAMRTGSGRHSREIQLAVLALVAEKMFDAVQQTRKRTNEVLALFPQELAAPYMQVRNLNELDALVQQQTQAETESNEREPWFPKWRDLFVRFDGPPFSEEDLKLIINSQGIISWTAANVFRRFKLNDHDVRQLRAYYDACRACDQDDWLASTIRSRVVHALGATDTGPAVDLLFDVLNNNDRYLWSRVGATRSLVEIAALTADEQLRRRVIDTLIDLVKNANSQTLAAKPLREIGQSAFYRNAHDGWQQAVTPLIALVRDRQQSTPEQQWWSNLLAEFMAFCQAPAPELAEAVGASPSTVVEPQ